MSPAEGIGGEAPTCSWRVDVGGSHDVDALAKRVSVISASEDGAFERHIKNVTTSRAECTMRGVPAKSHCELVIPLPEGAAARAVAVVSGSRTVELYAVRAPSYDRAYVKTVRASVVLPSSSETAGPSEDENARRRFECVAELGSVPCVALVLRLFVPSSGAAADQESTLGLRGVVVELKRRSSPTRGGGFPGAEPAEARNPPMGSPLRLDALAAATRDVAGLPPGNMSGMSGASAAAMLAMLRGMAGGEGGGDLREKARRPSLETMTIREVLSFCWRRASRASSLRWLDSSAARSRRSIGSSRDWRRSKPGSTKSSTRSGWAGRVDRPWRTRKESGTRACAATSLRMANEKTSPVDAREPARRILPRFDVDVTRVFI